MTTFHVCSDGIEDDRGGGLGEGGGETTTILLKLEILSLGVVFFSLHYTNKVRNVARSVVSWHRGSAICPV